MQKSYTKNYLRIYFWQILSIILNLLSIFIVIPRLSAQPSIYGIYSICAASIVFLSYADLGFMNAGMKFASESYARKEKEAEVRIVGFVSFILLLFVLLFAAVIAYLAFHPDLLIKEFKSKEETAIAMKLLLILAISSPNIVLQRSLQIFFGVRLEDFVLQKIQVGANILKILSVFVFFSAGNYNITGYFLFSQVATSLALITALWVARTKYQISIITFIKSIRFSKDIFDSIKSLAFNSLFVTISWILYYELDLYFIAKLSGTEAVAFYAVGFTCMSFFRSIFGTLFNPFTPRFNHLIAQNEYSTLKGLYTTIIHTLLPVVVFPTLSLALLATPFVTSWVGLDFTTSIPVVQLLMLSNILAFVSYPCGILLVAQKKIKLMYFISAILPLIFWACIWVLYPYVDFVSFAYAKLVVFLINGLVYIWFTLKFLEITFPAFLKKIMWPAVLPVAFLVGSLFLIRDIFPLGKDKLVLLQVVFTGGVACLLATILYYFTCINFRYYLTNLVAKLRNLAP